MPEATEPRRAVNVYVPVDLLNRVDDHGMKHRRNRSADVTYLLTMAMEIEDARDNATEIIEAPPHPQIPGQMSIDDYTQETA
jgi:hypothetical protein